MSIVGRNLTQSEFHCYSDIRRGGKIFEILQSLVFAFQAEEFFSTFMVSIQMEFYQKLSTPNLKQSGNYFFAKEAKFAKSGILYGTENFKLESQFPLLTFPFIV